MYVYNRTVLSKNAVQEPRGCNSSERHANIKRSDHLDNAIHPLRNHVAKQTKGDKTSSNAKEPVEVFHILAGNNTVHTPDTSHHVHREDDGTENSQLAEDVRRLFLALVHADIDLRKIVAVRSRQ